MNRLWYCFNCSTEFQSPRDLCPNCKADGQDPRAKGVIAPRKVIHFDPPHAYLHGKGLGFHACDPKAQVGTKGMQASGDIRCVNCPACIASAAGKAMQDELDNPAAFRVPDTVAPEILAKQAE